LFGGKKKRKKKKKVRFSERRQPPRPLSALISPSKGFGLKSMFIRTSLRLLFQVLADVRLVLKGFFTTRHLFSVEITSSHLPSRANFFR